MQSTEELLACTGISPLISAQRGCAHTPGSAPGLGAARHSVPAGVPASTALGEQDLPLCCQAAEEGAGEGAGALPAPAFGSSATSNTYLGLEPAWGRGRRGHGAPAWSALLCKHRQARREGLKNDNEVIFTDIHSLLFNV